MAGENENEIRRKGIVEMSGINIIPKIAELLGVETWEEFRIKDARGKDDTAYRLTDTSLEYFDEAMTNWCGSVRLIDLIERRRMVLSVYVLRRRFLCSEHGIQQTQRTRFDKRILWELL